MQRFLFIVLTFFSSHLFAEALLPAGCQPLRIEGESVLLKTQKSALFMIYNAGDKVLWLTHPVDNAGASAGWTSQLQPQRWSALSIGEDFSLSCVESTPGHEQQIPCQDAISVCRYKKVQFPQDAEGSYWAGENLPLNELLAHLSKRGFILPE